MNSSVAESPWTSPVAANAVLDVEDLHVNFHTRDGIVRAVDGVSFSVAPGETLGIVGESGSGKTMTAFSLLGLVPAPTGRVTAKRLLLDSVELSGANNATYRSVRGKRASMIFQDPMTALNPYMKVGKQLIEPLFVHEPMPAKDAWQRGIQALEAVGIQDAERRMNSFPHEFSGGMRQRVMIAMALITKPKLLIADEPTTALDVTVQAQILALIKGMQRELGMAVILITHDLGIVAGACDRVMVMYAGRIVESAPTRALYYESRHPYTTALLSALPATSDKGKRLYAIPGMPPDLSKPITGCSFAPRCTNAIDACRAGSMPLVEVEPLHATACARVVRGEL